MRLTKNVNDSNAFLDFLGSRKAQMEMIGLVLIVIMVIIGLMMFTVYKLSTPQKNLQKVYMNHEIATNMLVAITKTNVLECNNISLNDLIADCAREFKTITCPSLEFDTSCAMANATVFKLLNSTLIDWDVSFNFSVSNTKINFVNLNCSSKAKEIITGFEIIPLYPGQTEMALAVCVKK
jgi:hypothetical protein